MRRKIFITAFMLLLILQVVTPIKVNAGEKNPIFNSSITFSWEFIKNDDIMNYGLCTPSNVNDYQEIPMILWLHGLNEQGGDGNKISTAYDGFPKAILTENNLDGFCAYVVCPHIPVFSQQRINMVRKSNKIIT